MSLAEPSCRLLLRLARESIRHGLQHGKPLPVDLAATPPDLRDVRATFVTLEIDGRLRGCIGTLEAHRPLAVDVAVNAYESAFRDPRFPPVQSFEEPQLGIHISILTPPAPLPCAGEADLLAKLRPGVDGLILQDGRGRATFLPSVWDDLADPKLFLEHLKLKAGLPADHWSDTLRFWRYGTEVIEDRNG